MYKPVDDFVRPLWFTAVQHRIYPFKVWRDGELIMNMVPCFRNSDMRFGLYNSVTGKFHEVRYGPVNRW